MADDADDERPVSVTLRMDAATWRRLRSRLDALIVEFDLDSYVLRGPGEPHRIDWSKGVE